MVVLWLKLPETAVMVAVYVPAGVPEVVVVWGEDDPPQPIRDTAAKAMIVIPKSDAHRFRLRGSSIPRKIAAHATEAPPKERLD